jgi:phosphatidylserine/phosphatidylglycerophosphate/cardiolipin synthase-like enzyme
MASTLSKPVRSRLHRAVRRLRPRRHRLARGADVRLLVNERFLDAMEQSFREATRQILVEMYMIRSDATGGRFIDLFCEKARQGVDVWLVFDAVGSSQLTAADRKRLVDAGCRLRMFNRVRFWRFFSTFFRTHRRIVVVDDQVGYVGGFGFADEWAMVGSHGGPWLELTWQVRGTPLKHMIDAFARSWRQSRPRRFEVEPAKTNLPFWVINKQRVRGLRLQRALRRLVKRSEQRVWIATGYFVPNLWLVSTLRRAAKRGVDVRIMLPGPRYADHLAVVHAGRRHFQLLLTAGVKIYESNDRMLHAKAAIFDDNRAVVGSTNLDNWSLHYNKELNLGVVSTQAVNDLAGAMTAIQSQSTDITLEQWRNRPLFNRVLETFFGIGDSVL